MSEQFERAWAEWKRWPDKGDLYVNDELIISGVTINRATNTTGQAEAIKWPIDVEASAEMTSYLSIVKGLGDLVTRIDVHSLAELEAVIDQENNANTLTKDRGSPVAGEATYNGIPVQANLMVPSGKAALFKGYELYAIVDLMKPG